MFPNLKKLTVRLYGEMETPTQMTQWKEFFQNMRTCAWHVVQITMHIHMRCSFSELMEAMGGTEEEGEGGNCASGECQYYECDK